MVEWIQCTERLPDKDGKYICKVICPYPNEKELQFDKDSYFKWRLPDGAAIHNEFVVAWRQ